MNKIMVCLAALGLLFSPRAIAQEEFVWLSKPVLCGETIDVLKSMEDSGFKRVAKSTIVRDKDESLVGHMYYMIKDDDFAILEIFNTKSCIISISKYFIMLNQIQNKKNEL